MRWITKHGLAVVLLLLALAVGILAYGLLHNNAQSSSAQARAAAAEGRAGAAELVAQYAKHVAQEIEQTRRVAILEACRDQNHRHRTTIRTVDLILRRAERHARPPRRAQIRASRAPTLLLIDRLAPLQNCRALVASATTP